jgi:hypothetical protein
MIGSLRVIWLTLWIEEGFGAKCGWGRCGSGGFELGLGQHLTGKIEELIDGKGPGEEANRRCSEGIGVGTGGQVSERRGIGIAKDKDGYPGQPGVEFGDEGGSADAQHGVRGDDEAEPVGNLWLLNEAQGLRCVGYSDNVFKSALQN